MKTKVTEDDINRLLSDSEITVRTEHEKVTVVCVKLPNGFVLTEASGAVCKENYNEAMGKEICLKRIKNKLWELEGYKLAWLLEEAKKAPVMDRGSYEVELCRRLLSYAGHSPHTASGKWSETLGHVEYFFEKKVVEDAKKLWHTGYSLMSEGEFHRQAEQLFAAFPENVVAVLRVGVGDPALAPPAEKKSDLAAVAALQKVLATNEQQRVDLDQLKLACRRFLESGKFHSEP